MVITRTVTTDYPRAAVFAYVSDFTTTTQWDPGTIRTVRTSGEGDIGTEYHNISRFLGRTTELTYVVTRLQPGEMISLRGENKTVVAQDTMTVRTLPDGRTELTYRAEFTFTGASRLIAPLLAPAFRRLGDSAQEGLSRALTELHERGFHFAAVR
jgi:uncharacterized protein YndB with AHSA1/START domain